MIKDTLLKFLKMDSLVEHVTGYVETRIELMKVEVQEEVSKVLSKALVFVVIVSFLTLFVLLISMALAYKLGEIVGNFGGFAIIAGVYLLIGILMLIFRDSISDKIEESLQDVMKKAKK
jgi:uncharacterized membrane protein YqjE